MKPHRMVPFEATKDLIMMRGGWVGECTSPVWRGTDDMRVRTGIDSDDSPRALALDIPM